MDVAITGGTIAAVSRDIPASRASRVADANGLMRARPDPHSHTCVLRDRTRFLPERGDVAVQPDATRIARVSPQLSMPEVPAGATSPVQGTGDRPLEDRVLALLNIVGPGMKGGPVEQDLSDIDPRVTAMRVKEHPGLIVGIQAAHYRGPEWDRVDRASSRRVGGRAGHGGLRRFPYRAALEGWC